jgi:hypothetical protein
VDLSETERHELKSAPPDGFVVLRRMSYGHKLQRQAMAVQMDMKGQGKTAEASVRTETTKVAVFEFGHCIVDHNLEDVDGRKLDFTRAADVIKLHPQVGDEIDALIGDMNNFDTEEMENLSDGSEQASS